MRKLQLYFITITLQLLAYLYRLSLPREALKENYYKKKLRYWLDGDSCYLVHDGKVLRTPVTETLIAGDYAHSLHTDKLTCLIEAYLYGKISYDTLGFQFYVIETLVVRYLE